MMEEEAGEGKKQCQEGEDETMPEVREITCNSFFIVQYLNIALCAHNKCEDSTNGYQILLN